ncbi:MAG: M28 family peptidase, partial [Bacteroidota bacterium]
MTWLLCWVACSSFGQLQDSTYLKWVVEELCSDGYRNVENPEVLNNKAEFIFQQLEPYCDTVYYQTFFIQGTAYKNVVGEIGTKGPITVFGAHYDVCNDQAGADDNASGVAVLCLLSRKISAPMSLGNDRFQLVAYTTEEPPYFRTAFMGSYLHAKSLYDKGDAVKGMVSLEMLGYFDDAKGSQGYPIKAMRLLYGNKGDFLAVVGK